MRSALRVLGIPDNAMHFDAPVLIYSPHKVVDDSCLPLGIEQDAQGVHGDVLLGVAALYNVGHERAQSTVFYKGNLPYLTSHDCSTLDGAKRWLFETLRKDPQSLVDEGVSIELEPGEGLLFLGPVAHWAPCISGDEMRNFLFCTASFPGEPAHNKSEHHLPWTLAVEYDVSPSFDLARRLVLQYADRGFTPWTNWKEGQSMHKTVRGFSTAVGVLRAARRDERNETETREV